LVQIIETAKGTLLALALNCATGYFTQTFDTSQAETKLVAQAGNLRYIFFDRAIPIRSGHINRFHFQSMSLGVLNNRKRLIKTHRLIIERGCGKRRQVVTLEISTGVSNQGKAGRVRFRKTVESKRSYGLYYFILRLTGNPLRGHSAPQFHFYIAHACFRSLESHRPPQLFGFTTAEPGADHRHFEQLLLKQRDAQRALQNWFQ